MKYKEEMMEERERERERNHIDRKKQRNGSQREKR